MNYESIPFLTGIRGLYEKWLHEYFIVWPEDKIRLHKTRGENYSEYHSNSYDKLENNDMLSRKADILFFSMYISVCWPSIVIYLYILHQDNWTEIQKGYIFKQKK